MCSVTGQYVPPDVKIRAVQYAECDKIVLWTAFVRQRKWFARHLGTLCQRVPWQNDKGRPKTFQMCIAFKVVGHMNNSTTTFDNLASTGVLLEA